MASHECACEIEDMKLKRYSWKHKAFIIAIVKAKSLETIGLDNGGRIRTVIHGFTVCSLPSTRHSFTHGIYHGTDLCHTRGRRTNLGVTKHGLPTCLSYLTSDPSLAVNLFHPVLIQKKKDGTGQRGLNKPSCLEGLLR